MNPMKNVLEPLPKVEGATQDRGCQTDSLQINYLAAIAAMDLEAEEPVMNIDPDVIEIMSDDSETESLHENFVADISFSQVEMEEPAGNIEPNVIEVMSDDSESESESESLQENFLTSIGFIQVEVEVPARNIELDVLEDMSDDSFQENIEEEEPVDNIEEGALEAMSDGEVESDTNERKTSKIVNGMMHSFDEAVNSGLVKLNNLTPAELIGTFDALISCLVSWMEGDSMNHGLLTCLCLYETSRIEDSALSSYCFTVGSIVEQIQTIIELPNVFGVEDFELYGASHLKLFETYILSDTVIEKLKHAHIEWEHETKVRKLYRTEDSMAVRYRLHLIGNLFELLLRFEKFLLIGTGMSNVRKANKNIKNILDLLPFIKLTIFNGTQPNKLLNMVNSIGFSYRNPNLGEPTEHLMGRLYHRHGAYDCIKELMTRIKFAFKVTKLKNLYTLLNFCNHYAYLAKNCILSRSILQTLAINEKNEVFNEIPLAEFLSNSAFAFGVPRVMDSKHALYNDSSLKKCFNDFFEDICLGGYLTDLVCISGFNFLRQRSYLADMLETFFDLQNKTMNLDTFLWKMAEEKEAINEYELAEDLKQSARFSVWVLFNTLHTITTYMANGFRIEFYEVNDFKSIYGYSYEHLFGRMADVLKRAEHNLLTEKRRNKNQKKSRICNFSKSRNPPKSPNASIKSFKFDIIYYRGLHQMAGGMFKALLALTKAERMPPRKEDEEKSYNENFDPMKKLLSPNPVTFAEYKKNLTAMMVTPTFDLYAEAAEMFKQAHVELAKIVKPSDEVLDIIVTAKHNYVAMSILSKGYQENSKQQPEFIFNENAYFPLIKLV